MRAGTWQCEKLGARSAAGALLDAGRQGCCPAIRGTKGNLNGYASPVPRSTPRCRTRPGCITTGWAARTTTRPTGGRPSRSSRAVPGHRCSAPGPTGRSSRRAVGYLAGEAGIRQFLDIGTGLPTADNTHEVAQAVAPESPGRLRGQRPDRARPRPRPADQQPRGRDRPTSTPTCSDPDKILAEAARTLDFTQPVAVMLMRILQYIARRRQPHQIVDRADGRGAAGQLPGDLPPHRRDQAPRSDEASRARYNEVRQAAGHLAQPRSRSPGSSTAWNCSSPAWYPPHGGGPDAWISAANHGKSTSSAASPASPDLPPPRAVPLNIQGNARVDQAVLGSWRAWARRRRGTC